MSDAGVLLLEGTTCPGDGGGWSAITRRPQPQHQVVGDETAEDDGEEGPPAVVLVPLLDAAPDDP